MRRVAIVSGAGRGIGAAIAKALGREGYHVVVNYMKNDAAANAVVEEIRSAGGHADARQADVCDPVAVGELVGSVHEAHGRIDLLVCNANTVDPPFEDFGSLPWERFEEKYVGELAGSYHLTQRALAVMEKQRSGRIVYISSTAADLVGGSIAHATAKAALNVFGRNVAGFAARYGVTVNVIAAGVVDTEATAVAVNEESLRYFKEHTTFSRLVTPEELADAVRMVANDAFGAATGQIIRVDGGLDVLGQQLSISGRWNLPDA
ncbi:SDR family oxidoreductase [Streptomyces mirabilis]|uniref:SDR family oxidoreductase n=1 Tax=Streptomyces mirabilis TaxID=68239 RepID=UPI0022502754|nr:SDR family oxidoreductase [Streptomyces mirabilis]MCX4428532.1 SDR family oxidoreductase [Streptomyces mirabilis]